MFVDLYMLGIIFNKWWEKIERARKSFEKYIYTGGEYNSCFTYPWSIE